MRNIVSRIRRKKLSLYATLAVLVLLVLVLPLTVFLARQQQQTRQYAAGTDTLTLDPASAGITIAPDFGGFSYETADTCVITNASQQSTTGPMFLTLMTNLTPTTLRWGGSSVDSTTWNPTGGCSGSQVSQTTIDQMLTFTKQVNARSLWGVNLHANQPATFTDEAAYAINTGSSTLLGVHFGNEFELYPWTYTQLKSAWESYYNALVSKIANHPVGGPESCCGDTANFSQFITDEGSKIVLGTHHIYEAGINDSSQTITKLLSQSLMDASANEFDNIVSAGKTKNVPVQVDETNSIANGGTDGVSNVFASALWGLDYLLTAAQHGILRLNFHGSLNSGDLYTPISTNNSVPYARPLYYAMLAFRSAVPDGKIIPVSLSTSINLRAFAVVNNDGKLRVILINKDASNSTTVQINTTQSYTTATALRLTAPSLSTKTVSNTNSGGITFGGSPVAADGSWSPTTIEQISVSGSASSITVPAASAVVITYTNTSVTTTPTPIPQSTWRIDAGSTTNYTDSKSNVWQADTGITGGIMVNRGSISIANTSDSQIYQTEHYNMATATYAVPNGSYTVNLHFAETSSVITGPGQRIFTVGINGTTVLSNFDVYASAGGADIALIKSFPINVTNGQVTITFTPQVENPEINGIEILPATATLTPTSTPIPTPTNTPAPTNSPIPTNTPTPKPTNTPVPTATSTPIPTPTSVPPDTTPPTVAITSPLNGTLVRHGSTVAITATDSDNVGVTQVQFLVNGTLLCNNLNPSSPTSCNWPVPTKPGITYTITARAYDAMGNANSNSIQVKSTK